MMKNIYLLMFICTIVSCKKQNTLDDINVNFDSISSDTIQNAIMPIINDSANGNVQNSISIEPIKPKYAIVWVLIVPNSDSVITKDNMFRYQSIGSDVFEMMDVSEDAKYKKMDEFESTLYRDGAIPTGMNIRKRKILVFDSYSEASKQREEFIK